MFRENLKHIFTVPETVAKTLEWIEEGKLLQVTACTSLTSFRRQPDINFYCIYHYDYWYRYFLHCTVLGKCKGFASYLEKHFPGRQ